MTIPHIVIVILGILAVVIPFLWRIHIAYTLRKILKAIQLEKNKTT